MARWDGHGMTDNGVRAWLRDGGAAGDVRPHLDVGDWGVTDMSYLFCGL